MITEDYISFEVSKLLKEKGFDEPVNCFYFINGTFTNNAFCTKNSYTRHYAAPTLQMAMKWLREVYDLHIDVFIGITADDSCTYWTYIYLSNANNATSEKQLEKLLAINKLMNVAKYLNGDWKPDIKHEDEEVAYIEMSDNSFETYTSNLHPYYGFDVYFKSEELARQAIEILGEDTIRLALCVDY